MAGTGDAGNTHDKVGYVRESCTANGGQRSVIHGIFAPGAGAPTHYHERFDETFEVVDGALSVWTGARRIELTSGQRVTADRGVRHRFKNESQVNAVVDVIIEPGWLGFEQNIHILRGLQAEGRIEQFSKLTLAMVPIAMILGDLNDTHLVGLPAVLLATVSVFLSKRKIAAQSEELLARYCP